MSSSEIDRKRQKRSGRSRSLLPLLVFFIFLLVLASGVLVFLIRGHIAASSVPNTEQGVIAQGGFSCEYSEAQKLYPFSNGVLKVTSSRISYLSMSGTEVYGVDIAMDNPFCVIRDEYALIADSGGFFSVLLNKTGVIYQRQLDGAIRYATVSPEGYAAYILDKTDTKGSVYLVDPAAKFISEWQSVESGYPISLSFSPSEDLLNIALVDTDGSAMQPHLKQLSLKQAADGTITTKDFALYTPTSSEVLSVISYVGQDTTVLAGISDIESFSNGSVKKISQSYGQILSIFHDNSGKTFVVFSDGVGQEIRLEALDESLVRGNSIALGSTFVDAAVSNNRIIVAVDQKVLVINSSTLTVERTIEMDQSILRVSFSSDGNLIIVSADGVRSIGL